MAETDDDIRYRNRFRDGGDDKPMKRQTKRVFNKATGKHQPAAPKVSSTAWYKKKLGMGTGKKGTGALAKRRKGAVDSQIKKASQ